MGRLVGTAWLCIVALCGLCCAGNATDLKNLHVCPHSSEVPDNFWLSQAATLCADLPDAAPWSESSLDHGTKAGCAMGYAISARMMQGVQGKNKPCSARARPNEKANALFWIGDLTYQNYKSCEDSAAGICANYFNVQNGVAADIACAAGFFEISSCPGGASQLGTCLLGNQAIGPVYANIHLFYYLPQWTKSSAHADCVSKAGSFFSLR